MAGVISPRMHVYVVEDAASGVRTAIAHREPGHRIIGAGVTRAPLECFRAALDGWFGRYAPDC